MKFLAKLFAFLQRFIKTYEEGQRKQFADSVNKQTNEQEEDLERKAKAVRDSGATADDDYL
jgi:hypothetical protein